MERNFWSRVLKEKGLESPGREKAVQETKELTEAKRLAELQRQQEKSTKGRKRK